ncbi:hypothetical protein H0H92_005495 [Tricholoma furcatifolium]|nr:hypothetical protein H0H92_005495 [Tricholoma furcatifolium]
MRFSAALFTLVAATAAFAANITVEVGANGTDTCFPAKFAFTPSNITAQNGDNVIFEFHAKNHSVTQSTFADPCTFLTSGVSSGFQPVNTTTGPFPTWSITISNASAPLWFYCAQTGHCEAGMAAAMATNTTNATTSTASTSASSGVVPTALSIPATGSASTSSSATVSAQSTTPTNGAMHMGVSASGLLAFAGLVAGLIL